MSVAHLVRPPPAQPSAAPQHQLATSGERRGEAESSAERAVEGGCVWLYIGIGIEAGSTRGEREEGA